MDKKKSVDDVVEVEAEAEKETAEVAPFKVQEKNEDATATPVKSFKAGILLAVAGVTIAVAAAVILFNKSEQPVLASLNPSNEQQTVITEEEITTETAVDAVVEDQVVPAIVDAAKTEITTETVASAVVEDQAAPAIVEVAKAETVAETTQTVPTQASAYVPFVAPAPVPWGYAYAPVPYGYAGPPARKAFEDMIRRDQEAMMRHQEAIKHERQKRLELAQNRFRFDNTVLRDNRKLRPDAFTRQAEWRARVEKRREEADKRFNEMIRRSKEAREAFEKAMLRGI